MDVRLQWQVSGDVEGLVKTVIRCREQLTRFVCEKHSLSRAGVVSCEVYTSGKVIELLQCADGWKTATETGIVDPSVPEFRQMKKMSKLVAFFPLFSLHHLPVLDATDDVRVVLTVDVGETAPQTLFGNVDIVAPKTAA